MPTYTQCIRCDAPFPRAVGWGGRFCDQCKPPEESEFPLRLEVTAMRKRWLALRAALTAVEQAGAWLRAFESRWPENARPGLEEWRLMKVKVEAAVKDLK